MAGFTMRKRIEAPVATVFDVFTDFERAAEHIGGITKCEVLTDGPVGAGTRFRESRMMFKKEATEELEITSFEPGSGYTVGCESCGSRFETVFRFTAAGDEATEVEVKMDARPCTVLAKLMSPLSGMMLGPMKKCFDQDLEDLKKVAESHPQSGADAPALREASSVL